MEYDKIKGGDEDGYETVIGQTTSIITSGCCERNLYYQDGEWEGSCGEEGIVQHKVIDV